MLNNKYLLLFLLMGGTLLTYICYTKYSDMTEQQENLVKNNNLLNKKLDDLLCQQNYNDTNNEPVLIDNTFLETCIHKTKKGKSCLKEPVEEGFCLTHRPKNNKKKVKFIDTHDEEIESYSLSDSDSNLSTDTEEL